MLRSFMLIITISALTFFFCHLIHSNIHHNFIHAQGHEMTPPFAPCTTEASRRNNYIKMAFTSGRRRPRFLFDGVNFHDIKQRNSEAGSFASFPRAQKNDPICLAANDVLPEILWLCSVHHSVTKQIEI